MTKCKPLSISVDVNTDKMLMKLRAIAKHAEALADELEKIDSGECNNLSEEQIAARIKEKIRNL